MLRMEQVFFHIQIVLPLAADKRMLRAFSEPGSPNKGISLLKERTCKMTSTLSTICGKDSFFFTNSLQFLSAYQQKLGAVFINLRLFSRCNKYADKACNTNSLG